MNCASKCLVLPFLVEVCTVAYADFPVGQGSYKEWQPVVAYNSTDHEYLAVWSEEGGGVPGLNRVQAQRVAEDGTLIGGSFTVFGFGLTPEVTYNTAANEYLVAFNPGYGFLGQRVSNTGIFIGSPAELMHGISDGRLLYNSITGQYLFLGTALVETPAGSGYYNIRISSCKIGADGQALGSPLEVENTAHGYTPTEHHVRT